LVRDRVVYFWLGIVYLLLCFLFVESGFVGLGLVFGVLSVWMGQDVNQCELLEKLGGVK